MPVISLGAAHWSVDVDGLLESSLACIVIPINRVFEVSNTRRVCHLDCRFAIDRAVWLPNASNDFISGNDNPTTMPHIGRTWLLQCNATAKWVFNAIDYYLHSKCNAREMCDALSSHDDIVYRLFFSPNSRMNQSNNLWVSKRKIFGAKISWSKSSSPWSRTNYLWKNEAQVIANNIVLLHKGDAKLFRPFAQVF